MANTELITDRGCVTPVVLANVIKNVFEKDKLTGDEDFDLIDGWEELPEKYQDDVREALIQGHVQDDAWKGVSCNHPSAFAEPISLHSTSFSIIQVH